MNELYRLYHLAEKNGITVDGFDLKSRDALSFADGEGNCYIAIDPFKLESEADEKAKLAHELGHCMTGSFYDASSPYDIRQRHENRADRWAILNLLPREELEAAVENGYTEAWQLAELFSLPEHIIRRAVWFYKHGNLAVEDYGA